MIEVSVHVWRVDATFIAAHGHVLQDDEQARVRRFLRPEDGALFAMGRIQRRLVLARHLGLDPSHLAFTDGVFGKPALSATHDAKLAFCTSHGAGRVAIATATGEGIEIGVDIEPLGRRVSDRLAASCLAAGEQDAMAMLPAAERGAAFMRLWTCKEAVMKATGRGLQLDPRSIAVAADFRGLAALPAELGDPRHFQIDSRVLPDGFGLATCLHDPAFRGLEVRIREDG